MRPLDSITVDELYANISEGVFQQHVIARAQRMGYHVYHHTTVPQTCPTCGRKLKGGRIVTSKGWVDLVIGREHPPRLIFMELKSETGHLSPMQKLWRNILVANGAEWYTFKPKDWNELIRILKGER